jgi:epsilon-lactone hydrolase
MPRSASTAARSCSASAVRNGPVGLCTIEPANRHGMTSQTPIAPDMTLERVDERDARGWWVRPPGAPSDRAIMFIHGGGFMVGSAEAYRGLASQLATRAKVATFVVDYPLAPEHPYPAANEVVAKAQRWLAARGQVALVGDSAGGYLALMLASENIASIGAMSPVTDLAMTTPSMNDPSTHDPIFQRAALAGMLTTFLAGADGKAASPLHNVPASLPPIMLQVGANELLLDDARLYAERAAERGGEVHLEIYEGLHHVFQRLVDLAAARAAFDDMAAFIDRSW